MSEEKPFHLRNNYAPVENEVTAPDLEVEGAIPPELRGIYLRNGPNPVTGYSAHWFLGQGMLHGVRVEGGRAVWYRNRYVRTPYFEEPERSRISADGKIDHVASAANTHVVGHAGQILALEEGAYPWVLDGELNTQGYNDYGGKLRTAFTAHPHICPITGEMIGFGYSYYPPYLTYYRVSADGKLAQSEAIEVPGPTMMHDFMITERYAIFMDLPVVFNIEAAMKGIMPYQWSDNYGARLGIMPRTGTSADIKWFEVEPCYIFHTMNAWEEGDQVVCDVCRISELWRNPGEMRGNGRHTLHRFTLGLETGTVKEETLDERGMDFPRIADARVGQKNRFGYALLFATEPDGSQSFSGAGHVKFDFQRGTSEIHESGAGRVAGEPVFVPCTNADGDGDDGWVMSYVHDNGSGSSEFVIADASDFTKPPVARVKLPQRVPYGFHGSWIPDPA